MVLIYYQPTIRVARPLPQGYEPRALRCADPAATPGDDFGFNSVAVSEKTALVGTDPVDSNAGAAHIFQVQTGGS